MLYGNFQCRMGTRCGSSDPLAWEAEVNTVGDRKVTNVKEMLSACRHAGTLTWADRGKSVNTVLKGRGDLRIAVHLHNAQQPPMMQLDLKPQHQKENPTPTRCCLDFLSGVVS